MKRQQDPRAHDPTWHVSLNDDHQALIGWDWRTCRVQPRRKALRSLLNEEEPGSRYETGERIRRRAGGSRLKTYQRRRSGIQDAYRESFLEANRAGDHALTRAIMSANRSLFY